MWHLYLLLCNNEHYYVGITTNIERRFQQHCQGKGAKYTRANKPIQVLGFCSYPNRSQATVAEMAVKKLSKKQKLAFFCGPNATATSHQNSRHNTIDLTDKNSLKCPD